MTVEEKQSKKIAIGIDFAKEPDFSWMIWCEKCGNKKWTKMFLVNGVPHKVCDECYPSSLTTKTEEIEE